MEARIGGAARLIAGMSKAMLRRKDLSKITSNQCHCDTSTVVWM